MAEAFLQLVVDNLSSLMQREIGLIMGVDEEMKKLCSTLTTIQAVLEDAEDKQFDSKPIRNWLCNLKDLAFEIDDILDECATEVSKLERESSKLSRYSLKKILNRFRIGRKMKGVADKLDAVAAERARFNLRETAIERPSQVAGIRETGSILNEPDYVFGRDEEKEKIVDILVNHVRDCRQLSVLPIIGIGGLGKTTLAQVVFNDQRVTDHFDIKVWVCVSENFDLRTLIKAMIESATGSGSASDLVHLDALQRRFQNLLSQKRYLMVLDDIWNEDQEKWALLKSVLTCGSRGASVVVTTRLKKVADIMGTLPAHRLTGLLEEQCWLLFKRRAFVQEEREEYPNLEAIGRQIVKKCAGVPLAAKALGGLLRFKRKEEEWLYVKESEIWNLPLEETSILPVLRLSYHHLSSQLKQCFAYCAVFPKDSIMQREELIFRWMAHGYISSNGMLEAEYIGNGVWNELVLRSLFQDVKIYGRYTTFTMHDLVHDLAQSIMENKVPGAQAESSSGSASNSKIREVRINSMTDISSNLENFSSLRMLDASARDVEDFPFDLCNLKHMRYLNLSGSVFRSLPNTLCQLWNLQTLNLNGCRTLVGLPKQMRYMINLRHLFLEGCTSLSKMPPKIGELTSLKTLSLFIVGHEKDDQLGELQCLNLGGKLEIQHLERVKSHTDAKKANLVEKPNIRDLVLRWEGENVFESVRENMDGKVLEAFEPPPNLEALKIIGFKGRYFPLWKRMDNVTDIVMEDCPNCSRLAPLGELPRLESLRLVNLAVLEYILENKVQGAFPLLEELRLESLPNLQGLFKEEDGEMFPNLQTLQISRCSSLVLPRLSFLEDLDIYAKRQRRV